MISFIIVGVIFTSIGTGTKIVANSNLVSERISNIKNHEANQGSENWALLVAVGVYYNNPDQNRDSMLNAVDNLYYSLIDSPNWQSDHIFVLKGSQATTINLIKGLIWLIINEDNDDYSFVYITTHGGPLRRNGAPWDCPPKDESDGDDEVLAMYYGFDRYDHVTDDMLNFFFRFIQSKGLCVIIDSCYSGGFNDFTKSKNILGYKNQKIDRRISIAENFEPAKFTQDMVGELAAPGRIVMMSCGEEELSYNSYFSDYLTEGFNGWADFTGNLNGINSAEEAFNFAYPWVVITTVGEQHPTIADNYVGEFPVTYS